MSLLPTYLLKHPNAQNYQMKHMEPLEIFQNHHDYVNQFVKYYSHSCTRWHLEAWTHTDSDKLYSHEQQSQTWKLH